MKDYRLPRTGKGRTHGRPNVLVAVAAGFSHAFLKLVILVILITLTLGSLGFGLFKLFYPRLVDLKLSTTIVIVPSTKELNTNKILIAQYDSKTQAVTTTQLNAEEEISVIGGFGQYPLKSLYPLLSLEKKDPGFIRAALSLVLGQVVDGVIESDEDVSVTNAAELTRVVSRDLLLHPLSVRSNKYHFQLLSVVGQMSQNRLEQREISSLAAWEQATRRQALNQPDTDCQVAVVNTTAVSGLATKISVAVEGTGYSVIRVANTTSPIENSQILVDPSAEICFKQAKRLQNLLPVGGEVIADGELPSMYRAKIIMLIGQDVAKVMGS